MKEFGKTQQPEFRYVLAGRLMVGLVGTWKGNDPQGIVEQSFELADAFIERMVIEETKKVNDDE